MTDREQQTISWKGSRALRGLTMRRMTRPTCSARPASEQGAVTGAILAACGGTERGRRRRGAATRAAAETAASTGTPSRTAP
jgi:hypothetical protein